MAHGSCGKSSSEAFDHWIHSDEVVTLEEEGRSRGMTHEEAVGYLQASGWLQDHDKQIYEQGYRNGRKEAVKKVVCKGKEQTMEGYLDESRQLVFLSYITVEGVRNLGFDIISTVEEGGEQNGSNENDSDSGNEHH